MALSFQGFTIKNNLAEAFFDRTIFDNLAGSPEGSDVSLLVNNKRNTSSLTVTGSNISGNTISIPGALAVFSNRTPIKIDDNTTQYYVKNSNGVDTFQLSTSTNLSSTVAPSAGTYTRSDEITLSNISNFSLKRRSASSGGMSNSAGAASTGATENVKLLGDASPKSLLTSLEANLAFYKFRTSKSLNKNSSFLGRKLLKTNGLSIIKDPDGVIQIQGITPTGPGLFIYNAETGLGVRAFSSNANPWSDPTNGYLESTALQITMGKLTIANSSGIVLEAKSGATLTNNISPAQSISNSTFTHKLPVTINGETYYLCLKLGV
jgi:hypothetical protein